MPELTVHEKRTCTTCRKVQRPVVVCGERAVLARPVERVEELFR